jgi:hypothetical protein
MAHLSESILFRKWADFWEPSRWDTGVQGCLRVRPTTGGRGPLLASTSRRRRGKGLATLRRAARKLGRLIESAEARGSGRPRRSGLSTSDRFWGS